MLFVGLFRSWLNDNANKSSEANKLPFGQFIGSF